MDRRTVLRIIGVMLGVTQVRSAPVAPVPDSPSVEVLMHVCSSSRQFLLVRRGSSLFYPEVERGCPSDHTRRRRGADDQS